MREIKFRAWDKEQKDLFEVVAINYKKKRVYSSWNDLDGKNLYAEFDQAVLMQCTGSKDKNGVEIFEGDIVRGEDLFSPIGIYEIAWNDYIKGWAYKNHDISDSSYPDEVKKRGFVFSGALFTKTNVEVIGNIFENPELWEVQS